MNRLSEREFSSKVRLGMAIGVVVWIAIVFAWVILYGEPYIGQDADSSAFVARLVEFQ